MEFDPFLLEGKANTNCGRNTYRITEYRNYVLRCGINLMSSLSVLPYHRIVQYQYHCARLAVSPVFIYFASNAHEKIPLITSKFSTY